MIKIGFLIVIDSCNRLNPCQNDEVSYYIVTVYTLRLFLEVLLPQVNTINNDTGISFQISA